MGNVDKSAIHPHLRCVRTVNFVDSSVDNSAQIVDSQRSATYGRWISGGLLWITRLVIHTAGEVIPTISTGNGP